MATVAPSLNAPRFFHSDSAEMNTPSDPRTSSPSTPLSRSDSVASGQHPDLSNEIALLSTKLVNAINQQTTLEDSLQATQHELEIARQHIAQLEAATTKHQGLVSGGLLLKKADVDSVKREHETDKKLLHKELLDERKVRAKAEKETKSMEKELENERTQRANAEQERRKMEQELEGLTAALFEQANGMVSDARRETEAEQKRTEQLKNQLRDAEVLLHSHQEQLQDLKAVVEKISSEQDENESNAHISTAPSTPGMAPHDKMSRIFEQSALSPVTPGSEEVHPDQPLKLSHLIAPVLRHDLTAYEDFKNLAKAAAKATPAPSRVASGSYGSVNVMGLATGSKRTSLNSSPATPNFPSSLSSPPPRESSGPNLPALKDTSVYKRALAEDIEPTLRLDIAPGVNWMAKRTIMTSITSGNLVVEPMPPTASKFRGPVYACALCGENRKTDIYARQHRFRTSEADDAQRYPLCDHCLGRVRMSCDLIAFLRMVRDGHWRAETEDEINSAWEESVRLRERMFWQRIGGGVVPAYLQSPTFAKALGRSSEESQRAQNAEGTEDPFRMGRSTKRVSIGETVISQAHGGPMLGSHEEAQLQDEVERQLRNEMRSSTTSKSSGSETVVHEGLSSQSELAMTEPHTSTFHTTPSGTPSKELQRLSLTIPGSFN